MGTMTATSDPEEVTGRLCNWIADLKLDDVPFDVKERAKYLLLDGIACAIIGSHLPWSKTAVEALCDFEGSGPCTVIGWEDTRLGPLNAALLNSTFIQGFELDDYHSKAPLHSTALVIPSIMALAESMQHKGERCVTGEEFLLCSIAGFEVGPRVGLALNGASILSYGWHSGAVFGPTVSAAATSKLLRLQPAHIEHSFGIACTQACGLMSAQYGAASKRMQHGFAAKNGLFASLMSKGGYTGITQVFERSYGGYLSTFSLGRDAPHPEEVTKELGQAWQTMNIVVKPYPAMAGLHSTIDCFNQLHAHHEIKPSEVISITIEMPEAAFEHGGWTAQYPLSETGAQMNVAYIAAACILDGSLVLTHFTPKMINRQEIWELIQKVQVFHQPEFDDDPQLGSHARVKVLMHNGELLQAAVDNPTGVTKAMSNKEIKAKFYALTKNIISVERQQAIEEAILNIETTTDLSHLFNLLKQNVNKFFEPTA